MYINILRMCDLVVMYKIVFGLSAVKLNDNYGVLPLLNRHTCTKLLHWFNCQRSNVKIRFILFCLQVVEYVAKKGFKYVIT